MLYAIYTVLPLMNSAVFVIGITGNGLLLTIFIRRMEKEDVPKLRTAKSDG
jgi:hypothetical protein